MESGLPRQIISFLQLRILISITGHKNVFPTTAILEKQCILPGDLRTSYAVKRVRLKNMNSFHTPMPQRVRPDVSWFTTTIDTEQYIVKYWFANLLGAYSLCLDVFLSIVVSKIGLTLQLAAEKATSSIKDKWIKQTHRSSCRSNILADLPGVEVFCSKLYEDKGDNLARALVDSKDFSKNKILDVAIKQFLFQ